MKKKELIFCPLGGSGEIGMNMNLFAYGNEDDKKWLIVDIGVTFADDTVPGVDLIYPDPSFIVDKKEDLLGLVLTHAHEDHIGAIAHIWPKLLCNIYATPFTSVLIQEKFKEKKIDISNKLKVVELNGTVDLGDFKIEFVTLTHSILEPNGLSITTDSGTVLHTGDWKIDPNPLIGETINEKKLKQIGDKGVLAMICDSTNVFSPGRAGSESDVRKSLLKIMNKKEEFIFCPLGGSGEIGMNMNLFAYGKQENRKWIIVDIGVTFADDTIPGIDLIYPDPGFIVDKKDDLLGLVLTHAHEDHIGAIAHIWPKLLCNIYATPFTAALVTEKFK